MSDQETRDVLLAIGRLEGKVDTFQSDLRRMDLAITGYGDRIREIEIRWAKLLGAAAAVSALCSYIINAVFNK